MRRSGLVPVRPRAMVHGVVVAAVLLVIAACAGTRPAARDPHRVAGCSAATDAEWAAALANGVTLMAVSFGGAASFALACPESVADLCRRADCPDRSTAARAIPQWSVGPSKSKGCGAYDAFLYYCGVSTKDTLFVYAKDDGSVIAIIQRWPLGQEQLFTCLAGPPRLELSDACWNVELLKFGGPRGL
jgi:hypothetical protein